MNRSDLIDAECRVPLDGLLQALPGGFNAIPDIVQRRAAVEALLGAIEVPENLNVTKTDHAVPGPDGEPELADDGRQKRAGDTHTVLDVECGNMNVGADVKGHADVHIARVGIGTLHVFHARRTVDLLFDRNSYGLFDGLCIRTGILPGD